MSRKIGSVGRYGTRYGTKTKKIVDKIEKKQRERKTCPYCERNTLKRVSAGIWYCKKCKTKFAGAAFFPKSSD